MKVAEFSACRKWRYTLVREIHPLLRGATIVWVMLNPSTADETKDDPTIRRVKGFTHDWGYGRAIILNIYAFRSTDPKPLARVEDPIGRDNDHHIAEVAMRAKRHGWPIVCAWGAHGKRKKRGEHVAKILTTFSGGPLVRPMIHELKIDPEHYAAIVDGTKRAEVRRDDRPFGRGDWLALRRFDRAAGVFLDDQLTQADGPFGIPPLMARVVGVHRSELLARGHVLLSLGIIGWGPFLELRLPRPVQSIKNRRRLGTKAKVTPDGVRRVPVSHKSAEAKADMAMVRNYALVEAARYWRERGARGSTPLMPFGPDDQIHLEVLHAIDSNELVVRAIKVGTMPTKTKRGTRRDLHGMIETIADALQGAWYPNDSQIDSTAQRRIR